MIDLIAYDMIHLTNNKPFQDMFQMKLIQS